MARKIKNPVVVTMSKRVGEKLYLALLADGDFSKHAYRLADIVENDSDSQVGSRFTMELSRKDALEMHRIALHDVQEGGKWLTSSTYDKIEKAFRDAYDDRLRRSVGE